MKLGISTEDVTNQKWNKNYNLLKGLKEAEGEYLGLTLKEVEEEQEKLEENGSISYRLKLKDGEKIYNIGRWVINQKKLLNKYRGKTKEKIEQDGTIEPEEKRRFRNKPCRRKKINTRRNMEYTIQFIKRVKRSKRRILRINFRTSTRRTRKIRKDGKNLF